MGRHIRERPITTPNARTKLAASKVPYWRGLGGRGVHLGYRKGIDGGSWLVRVREPDGRYVTHGLGKADDGKLAANNVNGAGGVLDYEAACRAAAEWERFYNLARPHGAHNGKTPYEALRERL